MEHTKKFMLVDPQFHRSTIKEKTLSKLDNVIEEILQSDLTEDEKVKKYTVALNRYRAIEEYEPRVSESLKKEDFESDVIRSVPLAQQYKAKRLLDYLKKDPEIQWSDKGELIHRQNIVQNSNVVDLVSDLLRKNTTGENPEGWQQVADSLSKSNVPKEFILNAKRWRYIRTPSELKQIVAAPLPPHTPSTFATLKATSRPKTPVKDRSKIKTRASKRRRIIDSPVASTNWIPYH